MTTQVSGSVLANTAVTAGVYGGLQIPFITVDAQGRITSAANTSNSTFVISSVGNVGIGTSSPVSLLSIDTKNSSNGISVGDFFNNSAPGATPNIQTLGSRNDGNGTFGGRFGAAYRRLDGTAIASTASLGYYAFGGQWGTDTTYQSAKLLYTASVVGVAEGNFTSASAMPTAITFRTGATGESLTSVNTIYGTERMRIDSSGNVGIGTSSPTVRADIVGASGAVRGIALRVATDNGAYIQLTDVASHEWYIGTPNNDNSLVFGSGRNTGADGTERMRIDGAGNVGIGTSSPTEKLEVNGVVKLALTSAPTWDTNSYLWSEGGVGLNLDGFNVKINTGNTRNERMRIDSSGNVGIGTSSPSAKLQVTGTAHLTGAGTFPVVGEGLELVPAAAGGVNYIQAFSRTGNAWQFLNINSLQTIFSTNGIERMRIDSSGNVGINTSSPSSFGGNLVSYGSTIVSVRNFGNSGATNFKATAVGNAQGQLAGYSFYPTFQGTGDNGPRRTADIWSGFNGGAWGSQYLAFGVGSAPNDGQDATPERMRIDSSGNVGINSSSPGGVLDVRRTGTSAGWIIRGQATTVANESGIYMDASNNCELAARNGSGTLTARFGSSDISYLTGGNFAVGKTNTDYANVGAYILTSGIGIFTASGDRPLGVNRKTNDGTLVSFWQDQAEEGSISVSGTTVSYNGGHISRWSQLYNETTKVQVYRGTVLESVDDMCEWYDDEGNLRPNEQSTKTIVSTTPASKAVAGVFDMYDVDDRDNPYDFYVAQSGDFVIRVAAGTVVQNGDLLESAGDGTARVQADDICRSSTIAKVTSNYVSETYADGSFCVPCILMIG